VDTVYPLQSTVPIVFHDPFSKKSFTCTCLPLLFRRLHASLDGEVGDSSFTKKPSSFLKWKTIDVPLVYILIDFAQVMLD
jgi:hypothetical protein